MVIPYACHLVQRRCGQLFGGADLDILLGQQGNDLYLGGGGFDLAGFLTAKNPVTSNLRSQYAIGEGTDNIRSTEGLVGSPQTIS